MVTLNLTEQEAVSIKRACATYLKRHGSATAKRRRARFLTKLKKQYMWQKKFDSLLLAISGGKQNWLSGRAGQLARAIRQAEHLSKRIEDTCERIIAITKNIELQLPSKEQSNN